MVVGQEEHKVEQIAQEAEQAEGTLDEADQEGPKGEGELEIE